MARARHLCVPSVFLCFTIGLLAEEPKIARELLIQDTRQLAQILESAHPDPYSFGGGKIEFHKRMQKVLVSIPAEGLTVMEFYKLLLPFVAAVGDGHTFVWLPSANEEKKSGIPLGFDVVEQALYVSRVYREQDKALLGAKLAGVEGVTFAELVKRSGNLRGWDNEYHRLAALSMQLASRNTLELLLPEWNHKQLIRVSLVLPNGKLREVAFSLTEQRGDARVPPSKVSWPNPPQGTQFDYWFFDPQKTVCILRITRMTAFQERFAEGGGWAEQAVKEAYEKLYGKPARESFAETLAAIPSAWEFFQKMAEEMKEAKSKALIVDLRENPGGSTMFNIFLLRALYGHEKLWPEELLEKVGEGQSITKYSELYLSQGTADEFVEASKAIPFPLTNEDYDFRDIPGFYGPDGEEEESPDGEGRGAAEVSGPIYRPQHVVVVSSTWTYSAAYHLMLQLYRLGARLVGVPSAQAGNCFGSASVVTLKNSGIKAQVSHKQLLFFPNDPEKARVLRPHRELTYRQLKKWNFDPHAGILLALEEIRKH
ncbi:MAG: S41 family peptidase [Thermoanaerobaculum sp.]